ncbi:MAG: glycosyltransferase family 2 protein [Planctomycetota bacterium]|nr:MAG: glycosyltransferase family 2 protein [Planctomycetota bacterium]REJ94598.1 MAG: glycosyltransferase family 2 protein [Planctomycetota bacterium]REK29064.1 MAG: glycosyltransferase family 2 protein [Planctomycetota bacterium]REK46631.1 MAG: glycosyltransferase family 2 protein [Planctomycetota bacterium]
MSAPELSVPELSVIVAAFNEEDTIEHCLRRILGVYPAGCEILVVDGGSDDTRGVVERVAAENPSVRYVRNENDRGKGHATQTGIAAARAGIMAQIDADLQFLPEELPRLIEPIRDGRADVTLGSRFCRDAERRPGSTPFFRRMGNKTASLYASILFWHCMTDVQAGMKAWTREAADKIALTSDNYSYEVEIPVKALKRGLRVVDVPITTDARQGGETCVNVVTDGLVLLLDITRFRLGLR